MGFEADVFVKGYQKFIVAIEKGLNTGDSMHFFHLTSYSCDIQEGWPIIQTKLHSVFFAVGELAFFLLQFSMSILSRLFQVPTV